jgi:hypothetical protein
MFKLTLRPSTKILTLTGLSLLVPCVAAAPPSGLFPQVCPEHFTRMYEAVSVPARLYDFPRQADATSGRQGCETLRQRAAKPGRLVNGNSCTWLLRAATDLDHPDILEVTVGFQVFSGGRL